MTNLFKDGKLQFPLVKCNVYATKVTVYSICFV